MGTQILIVDDETAIKESIAEFLSAQGFSTATAGCAEDAITHLKLNPVDVVITDIKMPGMNGMQLTDHIKHNHDADVIIITGFHEEHSYEEAIQKGASDIIFKPINYQELLLRVKRVLRERKLIEELEKLARTDGLTKLYNSRHFYRQLEREIGRQQRYKRPLSLLMMDIDLLKRYNDNYGHIEGDVVLSELAKTIRTCLRKMDTGYRYGGEEFTILLPETQVDEAMVVAERIRHALRKVTFTPRPGITEKITVSIGITEYREEESASTFVARADKAMYFSKEKGRDRASALIMDN